MINRIGHRIACDKPTRAAAVARVGPRPEETLAQAIAATAKAAATNGRAKAEGIHGQMEAAKAEKAAKKTEAAEAATAAAERYHS